MLASKAAPPVAAETGFGDDAADGGEDGGDDGSASDDESVYSACDDDEEATEARQEDEAEAQADSFADEWQAVTKLIKAGTANAKDNLKMQPGGNLPAGASARA